MSVLTPLTIVLILSAACASPPERDGGGEIARAIDLESAMELRVEGDPLDAEPRTAERLSLAGALRLAAERDPTIQAALARVEVALADAQQARLLPNPILSLVLRFPEGGGRPEIEAGVAAEIAAILKRPRRTAAADRRLDAAVAEAVTTALDVVASLRERYAEAQALDELLTLLRARGALLDRQVELAQSRLDFGEGTRLDVTAFRTQRVELDIELAELELRRRETRLALARAIGEPSSAAEWTLDAWESTFEGTFDERPWIAAALAHRPELRSAVLELAALGDEEAIAALELWDGSQLGLVAERTDVWRFGPELAVPIPLFDLGAARRARASAEIVAARHELVDIARGIVEDVRRALARFDATSRSLARVRDELMPLERQRRDEVEAIFASGSLDITALLLAERGLQATHTKQVELELRAAVALTHLERAVGGPAVTRDIGGDQEETGVDR